MVMTSSAASPGPQTSSRVTIRRSRSLMTTDSPYRARSPLPVPGRVATGPDGPDEGLWRQRLACAWGILDARRGFPLRAGLQQSPEFFVSELAVEGTAGD